MSGRVRLLAADDVPAALTLCRLAGWNQTPDDWHRLLRLSPNGCWGVEVSGAIVATTTVAQYGDALAWVGMVLTHPGQRRQGHARQLMEVALAELACRGVRWAGLDASDMGRPLYRDLGFAEMEPVERWVRDVRPSAPQQAAAVGPQQRLLDRDAFGANRSPLLTRLAPVTVRGEAGAFALVRRGHLACQLGPVVARNALAAEQVVADALHRCPQRRVFWDLLPGNAAARRLAHRHGFRPARRLVRMLRPVGGGAPWQPRREWMFALAGFEWG